MRTIDLGGYLTPPRGGRRFALAAKRPPLPCSAGLRFLSAQTDGASSEKPGERLDESTPSLDNGLRPPIRAVAADAERPLSIRVHAPQPAGGDRAASAADLLAPAWSSTDCSGWPRRWPPPCVRWPTRWPSGCPGGRLRARRRPPRPEPDARRLHHHGDRGRHAGRRVRQPGAAGSGAHSRGSAQRGGDRNTYCGPRCRSTSGTSTSRRSIRPPPHRPGSAATSTRRDRPRTVYG